MRIRRTAAAPTALVGLGTAATAHAAPRNPVIDLLTCWQMGGQIIPAYFTDAVCVFNGQVFNLPPGWDGG